MYELIIALYGSVKKLVHTASGRLLLILSAGAGLGLAFPPWGLWWLVVPAFALIYMGLAGANWPWEAARLGFVFGFVFYLLHTYWFYSFHPLALPLVLSILGLWHALWALGIKWFRANPFYFAAGWLILEGLLSRGYLAFPWSRVATALARRPLLVQPVAYTGEIVWGSLWILAGCLLGDLLLGINKERFIGLLLVVLLIGGGVYGGYLRRSAIELETTEARAVLIQHNVSSVPVRPGLAGEQKEKLIELTQNEIKSGDLVIWPETSLLEEFRFVNSELLWPSIFLRKQIEDLVPARGQLMTGARFYDPRPLQLDYLNGALLVDGQGEIIDYYSKRIPVPGGEHLPFMGRWEWMYRLGRNLGTIGYRGGDRGGLLEVQIGEHTFRAGVQICFEDAFDYFVRRQVREGADLLINISNDSWSRSKASHHQHGLRARLRAIETGRPLLRVGNTGLSAIIDPFGYHREYLPPYTAGEIRGEVPLKTDTTPFVRFGHILTGAGLVLLSLLGYLSSYFTPPD